MPTLFWKKLLRCLPTTAPSSSAPFSDQEDDNNIRPVHLPPTATEYSSSKHLSTANSLFFSSTSFSASDSVSALDFAAIFASHRFFFPSPGRSNSIVESSATLPPLPTPPKLPLTGGVAVKKYSPDPYKDFKRSMQEMIEARRLEEGGVADWDYLHELLSCYLSLNLKHTHKFIIGAFADIVIARLSSSTPEFDSFQLDSQRLRHDHQPSPCLC